MGTELQVAVTARRFVLSIQNFLWRVVVVEFFRFQVELYATNEKNQLKYRQNNPRVTSALMPSGPGGRGRWNRAGRLCNCSRGVREDYPGSMSVFLCAVCFDCLAVVGFSAKTPAQRRFFRVN